jgi:hypothetical protein
MAGAAEHKVGGKTIVEGSRQGQRLGDRAGRCDARGKAWR